MTFLECIKMAYELLKTGVVFSFSTLLGGTNEEQQNKGKVQ